MEENLSQGLEAALESALSKAKSLLSENPSAAQVNLLMTANERIYSFLRRGWDDETQENECLRQLQEDENAQLVFILCMWQDLTIDLPSYALRTKLLAMNAANGETRLLLRGENGINSIPLARTLPDKQ